MTTITPYPPIFFYANRNALLLDGRSENMEYGSHAFGAPDVFIDDPEFKNLWGKPQR
jgi:hypothetical protein